MLLVVRSGNGQRCVAATATDCLAGYVNTQQEVVARLVILVVLAEVLVIVRGEIFSALRRGAS